MLPPHPAVHSPIQLCPVQDTGALSSTRLRTATGSRGKDVCGRAAAVPAASPSPAAAPAAVAESRDPRVSPQSHTASEACALALHVTVLAGHGSSLHLRTLFATITWSQDSALHRTQGICVPPGGPTGVSQAGGGPGLLLATAGCHGVMSVLGLDEIRAWRAHACAQVPERSPSLTWKRDAP